MKCFSENMDLRSAGTNSWKKNNGLYLLSAVLSQTDTHRKIKSMGVNAALN